LQSYSYTFDYLQKDFEKILQKNLQKQNKWCKCGLNWFNSKHIFALTLCKLVQFCTYIFALVCVGINHQNGGD
jgi:hypothetical protein